MSNGLNFLNKNVWDEKEMPSRTRTRNSPLQTAVLPIESIGTVQTREGFEPTTDPAYKSRRSTKLS